MTLVQYKYPFLTKIKKSELVAIDTETESLSNKTLLGFSIAFNDEAHYIPVRDNVLMNMSISDAKLLLQTIVENCAIVFHNASFDIPTLNQFGINFEGRGLSIQDTLVMSNLIDENTQHGLKPLTKKYFNYDMKHFKDICGTGKKRISFADAPKEKANYGRDDALYTLKLYNVLKPKLDMDRKILQVYCKIERPLLKVIGDMHTQGIMINVKKVKEISDFCKNKIELDEAKLKLLIGDINFGSPKQLREYFIGQRNMPVIKESPTTGAPSMDKEVLEKYAETNPEAKLLLEYRKYSKIFGTFIPALTPTQWDISTMRGRIYASFNQSGTVSGRFSSSRPNMQNMPRESKYLPDGKLDPNYLGIREAIVADDGHILIGADYSQIELRVLAHFSRDFNLIKAYTEKKDIHQQTAEACGITRQQAKTVNFGLVYGMGNKTLAKQIKVSASEAQQYIDRYFNTYPGVKTFWEEAEEKFRNLGYVETVMGRKRRRTPAFFGKDEYGQGAEIRSATNSVIQGSAADMIKMSMIMAYPELKLIGARLVLTVHDELLVSCPKDKAKEGYMIVLKSMMTASEMLTVPVEVEVKFGNTWGEAHGEGIKLEDIYEKK